jgi:catechol 2,3-dioxygenase-like lactoylglutathione lyase family enzyme
MRDWYSAVPKAKVIDENPQICFLSYDDEHYRVALFDPGPLSPRRPAPAGEKAAVFLSAGDLRATGQAGVHHVAYTYESLGDPLDNYLRLTGLGICPYWCINRGPTTSMCYRDPDGNQIELQIDNYPVDEGRAGCIRPHSPRTPSVEALIARWGWTRFLPELRKTEDLETVFAALTR